MKQIAHGKGDRASLLCLVLVLGACLRIVGLTWGLDKMYHPDEFISMRGVAQLNLLAADFTAPGAYFEGTFNYYLWSLPVAAIKLLEKPNERTWQPTDDAHFARILLLGRVMTVIFDTLTIFAVFIAINEAINAFYPALFGAFLYAVIPVQVIYAHFMRPHVLSNLLCTLVIWLSFKLLRTRQWWLFLIAGIFSGLAGATRYPAALVAVFPCLCVMFAPLGPAAGRFWERVRYLVSGPLWWIGLGFIGGLFIGEPILFLDLPSVIDGISRDTLRFIPAGQFVGKELLNVAAIWKYLSVLIPFGMWPLLWIIPYTAMVYLCFRKNLFRFTIPILLFSLFYLYPMAKGYYTGIFVRATMPLFPGFCILTGIACYDIFSGSNLRQVKRTALAFALLLLVLPSIIFDCAYVRAMQRTDPRSLLRQDLKKMVGTSSVQIGVQPSGAFFYTVMPAVKTLENPKIQLPVQNPSKRADFYLIGFRTPISPDQLQKTISLVEGQRKFVFLKQYSAQPRLFGRKLDLSSFPTDMTFPFPTLLLFRFTASTEASH